jgi:alpha/beta superfamily hydrolase
MRQKAVMFQTQGLNFEGIVAEPEDLTNPVPGVAICHPGPLNGGNMDNNVVIAVSYALVDLGFSTIRFNFRGVGNSEGQHSRGECEYEEALGAFDFLESWPGVDSSRLGLAGYSFGNGVILGSPSLQARAKVFAFVSPSLQALQNTCLKDDPRPKFIITGDLDRLAPSPECQPTLDSFKHTPTYQVVEGVDHFWVGREPGMAQQVSQFLAEHLK